MLVSPDEGFLRLEDVIAPHGPIPVKKSTWWAGVASGRFPKPVKCGRLTFWRRRDIRELIARIERGELA
jgi:predicted DNA-binding transcriptional regulator AlpA